MNSTSNRLQDDGRILIALPQKLLPTPTNKSLVTNPTKILAPARNTKGIKINVGDS